MLYGKTPEIRDNVSVWITDDRSVAIQSAAAADAVTVCTATMIAVSGAETAGAMACCNTKHREYKCRSVSVSVLDSEVNIAQTK